MLLRWLVHCSRGAIERSGRAALERACGSVERRIERWIILVADDFPKKRLMMTRSGDPSRYPIAGAPGSQRPAPKMV